MKPNAIFLCESTHNVDYVYSPEQRRLIAERVNLRSGIFNRASLETEDFSDIELIFSTWGMPALTDAELDRLPNLKALFYGAGATDAFVRPFLARGVAVSSAWQANAIPVAEYCVAQIILGLKGFLHNTRLVTGPEEWKKKPGVGPGCYGETVALIGAGAIATRVRDMLEKQYNVNVLVVPSRPERRTVSIEEAFRRAFVVSNHLPNRDDNRGAITGEMIRSMRPNALFLNTGRGAQVDEAGLIAAMKERPDLTAVLDVTDPEPPAAGSELYTLPNVLLSTHIAGSMNDEVHRMADYMIEELDRCLAGEKLRYRVEESMLLTSHS